MSVPRPQETAIPPLSSRGWSVGGGGVDIVDPCSVGFLAITSSLNTVLLLMLYALMFYVNSSWLGWALDALPEPGLTAPPHKP